MGEKHLARINVQNDSPGSSDPDAPNVRRKSGSMNALQTQNQHQQYRYPPNPPHNTSLRVLTIYAQSCIRLCKIMYFNRRSPTKLYYKKLSLVKNFLLFCSRLPGAAVGGYPENAKIDVSIVDNI
jgi:hypothetical protein